MVWSQPKLPSGQLDSFCSFLWALDEAFHLLFFPPLKAMVSWYMRMQKKWRHELVSGAERTWDPMRIRLTCFILGRPCSRALEVCPGGISCLPPMTRQGFVTPRSFGNGNKFQALGNSLVSLVRTWALKPDLVKRRRKAGHERWCLVRWLLPFPLHQEAGRLYSENFH